MGMQLNIKGAEAHELASRLSELTGKSRTAAVIELMRARVAELERQQSVEERVRKVMALAAEMRAEILRCGGSLDDLTTDSLYDDETGLPI